MTDDETNEFIRGMAIEAAKEMAEVRAEYEAEIERLRAEVRHAANVCDALSALDDLGPFASVRVMADHARRFRRALGDE